MENEKVKHQSGGLPSRPLIGCAARPEPKPVFVWENFREWMLKPRNGKWHKPYRKNHLVAITADGQRFLHKDNSDAWNTQFPVRVYLRRDVE